TATTEIYTLSLHDALPICLLGLPRDTWIQPGGQAEVARDREQVRRRVAIAEYVVQRLTVERNRQRVDRVHEELRVGREEVIEGLARRRLELRKRGTRGLVDDRPDVQKDRLLLRDGAGPGPAEHGRPRDPRDVPDRALLVDVTVLARCVEQRALVERGAVHPLRRAFGPRRHVDAVGARVHREQGRVRIGNGVVELIGDHSRAGTEDAESGEKQTEKSTAHSRPPLSPSQKSNASAVRSFPLYRLSIPFPDVSFRCGIPNMDFRTVLWIEDASAPTSRITRAFRRRLIGTRAPRSRTAWVRSSTVRISTMRSRLTIADRGIRTTRAGPRA